MLLALAALVPLRRSWAQEPAGSIRGIVYDKDFGAPLPVAQVTNVETGETVETTDQGNFVFAQVPPGRYTLVFAKAGYVRQVRSDVVVSAGQLTDVDASLTGEFTEMEEFVVQDVLGLGAGTEAALLQLRLESPALMDSISADLMSRAGASDAASALRLVAGASLKDGKSAVVRGLPDRYVSSQLNHVRLPSADEDKRAVELDQFPSPVIESIQVSKTFTPDQQGDASGGAVDVRLKGIPEQTSFQMKLEGGYNSQTTGRGDFLTYDGGGLTTWGRDDGGRDIQYESVGGNWDGAVGTSEAHAPTDFKWSVAGGGRHELGDGWRIGGFGSLFYERDSSYYDGGVDDKLWVDSIGQQLSPQYSQGTPSSGGRFFTALFDTSQGSQSVRWGGLGTVGVENERNSLGLTYLYTHVAEDVATLAVDTRGKSYYFPGYDPNDPGGPGNVPTERDSAPYLRLETLEYTERTTQTLQLNGRHELPLLDEVELGDAFVLREPILSWTYALSSADLDQPDKRQFGAYFLPDSQGSSGPVSPSQWRPLPPDANINLGNLQRIWKTIEEDSDQYSVDLELPFDQWAGERGSLKLGLFDDRVERTFDQDTYANFGDASAAYFADFDQPWSTVWPYESHPIQESLYDVDYTGDLNVSAFYGMAELPVLDSVELVGGVRFESTHISTVLDPEPFAQWVAPGDTTPTSLEPGEADVDFDRDDVLPAIGLQWEPVKELTLRASYSQTVARQTFKELTPILQQEYLGGPVFVGNPELGMSSLDNYDLRCDYTPYQGALLSASLFHKKIDDPIEYVQKVRSFVYTTAENYPEGEMNGLELEARQALGHFWEDLEGVSVGANATFIDAVVQLTREEVAAFDVLGVPMSERDMTAAPKYLFNLFLTYDVVRSGTQLGLFYTLQGDTLVAGAGEANGHFVPSVYALPVATLNASLSQRIGPHLTLQVKAKNLTNPDVETVYRSDYTDDATRTSFTRGIDVSASLTAQFSF